MTSRGSKFETEFPLEDFFGTETVTSVDGVVVVAVVVVVALALVDHEPFEWKKL